nr:FBD-associated F-box protein At1g66310-like [Aegilops tauschii subsp. strangulata]
MRKKKPAASSKNRFGDLPDDLLRHVLSFLPAGDALQTCVLDTRWRDHWRRTTNLLLVIDHLSFPSLERFKQIVKLFIHLRGNSPLGKFKINTCLHVDEEHKYTNTRLLIEYALKCQVKELLVGIDVDDDDGDFDDDNNPLKLDVSLISQHLKTLHLKLVNLKRFALDLSSCPALEDLEMQHCDIDARRISSKSLQRLCITDICSFPADFRVRIFAPGLISLHLYGFRGLTPSFEYIPLLETAYVWVDYGCNDSCRSNQQGCELEKCGCHAYPIDEGVLLHGLSDVANLELLADNSTVSWDSHEIEVVMVVLRLTVLLEDVVLEFGCEFYCCLPRECQGGGSMSVGMAFYLAMRTRVARQRKLAGVLVSSEHQWRQWKQHGEAATRRDLEAVGATFGGVLDTLQTCVLDTRWRDIWRRSTNLLLVLDESSFPSHERFKQLVKLFINLRGNSPLDKCEISACPEDETDCTYTNTKMLIEYSLACQLKELP